ncbi:MAG: Ig-like domain-containing protein [Luteibaculum sp.]
MNKHILFLFAVLLLAACAKIGSPTGGEEDSEGPEVISSQPENFSTQIAPKEIELEFNEFITLGNPEKDWIISPPLKYPPKVKLRGKTLKISLRDTLEAETTYTINFGESIKDLHEGNLLENPLYVFSTGAYIDSGRVVGKTIKAENTEILSDISIGLYPSSLDSFPVDTPPLYFARSKEGVFVLPYLKQARYHILAWKDDNADKKWSKTEALAFLPELVEPITDSIIIDSLDMRLYTEIPDSMAITKFRLYDNQRILLEYNAFPRSSEFEIRGEGIAFQDHFEDSSVVWFREKQEADSLRLFVQDKGFNDTLVFYPFPIKEDENDTLVSLAKSTVPDKPGDSLQLIYPEPLAKDSFLIRYFLGEDSLGTQATAYRSKQRSNLFLSKLPSKLESQVRVNSGVENRGLYRSSVDSLKLNYQIGAAENYGSFSLNLINDSLNYENCFILLGVKEKLKKYPANKGKLKIDYLNPSKLELYLVVDTDGNGKFSPGSIYDKKLPESVFKYPDPIEVRANWDLEIDWNIKVE